MCIHGRPRGAPGTGHRALPGCVLVTTLFCGSLLAAPVPVAAQIPDTFENLQILPKDISRGELTGIMRGFSAALGVRCQYCHPGGSGGGLEGVDFKTDEDPDKVKARFMMKMTADLNARLPELPDRDAPALDVRCVTCHRGLARPITLEEELHQVVDRAGAPAAVARYRELRDQYYGSGAYDFGANSLNELGGTLAQAGKQAEAIAILELNAELFPEDVPTAVSLGQLHARAGNREKAIASLERALRLEPNNRQARQALQRLQGG